MPDDIPIVWFASLEKLTLELNLELSRCKVIGFHNFGCGLIKDSIKSLVYFMGLEWVGDSPQRNILNIFGYEEPFFKIEESCSEHKCGRIGWAKEKPFGMSRAINNTSFTFEYGSEYAATISEMSGKFPYLKYKDERRIGWGEK